MSGPKKQTQASIKMMVDKQREQYRIRLVNEFGYIQKLPKGEIHWGRTKVIKDLNGRSSRKADQKSGLGVPIICGVCGEERWQWAATQKGIIKTGKLFSGSCARCTNASRVGDNNGFWRGGKRTSDGYIQLRVDKTDPLQVAMSNNGYVLEHRLVAARRLGRPLTRDEEVHHKNFNRQDNRPCNLAVMSRSIHGRFSYINLLKRRIRVLERCIKRNGLPLP